MYILMSFKPKWAELILSGRKTVELRRTRPNAVTGIYNDTIFICFCGKIHGYCKMGDVVPCGSTKLWQPGRDQIQDWQAAACVTPEEWASYTPKHAWNISTPRRFAEPIPLSAISPRLSSPQSWRYLRNHEAEKIMTEGRALE